MSRNEDLNCVRLWIDNGELEKAANVCYRYLKDDPEDPLFLTMMGAITLQTQKAAIAYSLTKRATQLAPKNPGVWLNHGQVCNDLWREREAEKSYKRALELAQTDEQKSMMCVNLASVYIDTGRYVEAEPYCHKAIELNPGTIKGIANLGFCQLAQRKWEEGFKNYRKSLGSEWRPIYQYANEPLWEGQRGKVILYAEQGIGDQLSFASMLPDASRHNEIILDVEERLVGLMSRSFPNIKVYGTRVQKGVWDEADKNPDYSLPMGQIGEFYRKSDADFNGKPYLKADPDRTFMWKSLFKKKGKPVIGIAWRGGIHRTGAKYRQWDLEQLLPILKSVDAHWVSLQYKSAKKEIAAFKKKHPEIDIVEYPHATLSVDYDDTAALVAALDHVICIQTAVCHLAGGLGIPCWVHVPVNSQWRYGADVEDFVWASSVKIIRQHTKGEWDEVIKETAERLRNAFPRKVASKQKLAKQNRRAKRQNGSAAILGESRQGA